MKFFSRGTPVVLTRELPGVTRVKAALDELEDGELLTGLQLSSIIDLGFSTLNSIGYYSALAAAGYAYVYQHRRYFASKRTIKALERKDHEQRK